MLAMSQALLRASESRKPRIPSLPARNPGPLAPVTVHVFSDVSCPWCHIGARRLQRAVRQYKRRYGQAAPVDVQWNPLLVHSDVTTIGEDVDSYAPKRWGCAAQLKSKLVRAGLPEGAAFSNWKTMPNSLLAHELVTLAHDVGLAEQANELLFARTYEQGRNISLLHELLDVGESLGMSRESLRHELMRSDRGSVRASVLERDAAAKQRLRIKAVPHFIVAGPPNSPAKYALNGAHQTSDLLGAMERVALEAAPRSARSALTATTYGAGAGAGAALIGEAARSVLPVPVPLLAAC